jgi:hypothetical protein
MSERPSIDRQWCSLLAAMMSFHIRAIDARSGVPVTRTSMTELTQLIV